jgi:hypothetical protein
MEYEAIVKYNSEIINSAIKQVWIKWCLKDVIVGVLLLLISCFTVFVADWDSWIYLTLLVLCVIFLIILVCVYIIYKHRSISNFKKMESPNAIWKFNEHFISTKSDIGNSEFKWKMIKSLYCFHDVWVLQYINQSISILPTATLSQEAKKFIVKKMTENGVKIT